MRLVPKSLFGRLILVMLSGLVLAQLFTAFILLRDRGQALYDAVRQNLIVRTTGIVRLLDPLTPAERQRLLPLLSGSDLQVTLSQQPLPLIDNEAESRLASEVVKRQLVAHIPDKRNIRVSVEGTVMQSTMHGMHQRMMGGPPMSGPWAYARGVHAMARFFRIQIELADGTWVRFERGLPEEMFDWPVTLLIALSVLLLSVILLSLFGVHTIVRPLRELRQAAEGLGKDIHQPPLEPTGPSEVRETARAFNTMQQRLKNYIEDRAGILAAVSHDLKTPLTRLRLRTDLMDDDELREKTHKDLEDMEAMVTATLDFMRGTETGETSQRLDLMALLESVQQDAQEAGKTVSINGHVVSPYTGKPLALKRCIVNLVENAVRYGGSCEISVEERNQEVVVDICDQGPGIPEDMLEKVFAHFVRVESSRAQHTGGTGLGLGIARNIARAHGGDLALSNRSNGGLCARLKLPK
ncbi:MAG: ATP-binding protein [Candidatus Thiodiazotropha endolucinida]|nr:ATP-binding protein [Candidatus Thiodiazotropha taylori]MCW4226577.1 ATP-binding protein [Candidatus Thiodiazotropha endolucinida]MCG7883995.1 ATP-binding protein [Candidatus Thiodiazotropha taylori]MCG7888140.1 ATP-binding protein [Candidatus Thiodiazotropha taylori]MCG7889684.1 ATP-binding protein [Candidatus Thiodiazotropha taylori]